MRAPALRALGFLSASGRRADASPEDAPGGVPGRPVLSLGRPGPRDDRLRRATRECLLALAAVEAMLEDGKAGRRAIAGERTALLYATAAGYAASNRGFIEASGGSIHFAYTAPAVVPAEVAIEFDLTGPYSIFLGGPPATLRARASADGPAAGRGGRLSLARARSGAPHLRFAARGSATRQRALRAGRGDVRLRAAGGAGSLASRAGLGAARAGGDLARRTGPARVE